MNRQGPPSALQTHHTDVPSHPFSMSRDPETEGGGNSPSSLGKNSASIPWRSKERNKLNIALVPPPSTILISSSLLFSLLLSSPLLSSPPFSSHLLSSLLFSSLLFSSLLFSSLLFSSLLSSPLPFPSLSSPLLFPQFPPLTCPPPPTSPAATPREVTQGRHVPAWEDS